MLGVSRVRKHETFLWTPLHAAPFDELALGTNLGWQTHSVLELVGRHKVRLGQQRILYYILY
jgi:hypothetical protein